ncbi:hypothetical protein BGZ83_001564 [Gryganskiella cystojenkinii]|nr:hypothetical protein BGZ83_001564 [Gryganskiella cystojenkinii]
MDSNAPYDDWSKHVHAVITFLQPFLNDWRSYARLLSTLLGVGVLIMENQVLLRMRMGRWEILGYIASLLPAPVAKNYRFMGAVCISASVLTLIANILYMLRGWKDPSIYFDWALSILRWTTSQVWYAIAMISLFHVVTRPAQSGVVFFGKFPRDLWAYKWYLCILYIPVHYMLLELCNIHRETKQILIPLEIIVDLVLYNGPFLIVLLRLLYQAWKVAYDEAVLTGAVFEDESTVGTPMDAGGFTGGQRRATSGSRPGTSGYVGLAMEDLDSAERGQAGAGSADGAESRSNSTSKATSQSPEEVYILEDEDDAEDERRSALVPTAAESFQAESPRKGSPVKSAINSLSKNQVKKSVVFDMEDETDEDEGHNGPGSSLNASPGRGETESLV